MWELYPVPKEFFEAGSSAPLFLVRGGPWWANRIHPFEIAIGSIGSTTIRSMLAPIDACEGVLLDDTERMLIERACERLVQTYCHLTDHGRAAEVAGLFAEDGVWVSAENTMSGRARILRGFQRRQENAARMSRHVCSNLLIDVIDSDTAEGVVYLTLYRHDGEPDRLLSPLEGAAMVGEYCDAFVRTTDGWRFKRRELSICFSREAAHAG